MFRNERHINLAAIEDNVQQVRAVLPDEINLAAVVKADGYGHGGCEAAKAAISGGADFLAVATVDEGVALRKSGITKPVLNLGIFCEEENLPAVINHLTMTVSSPENVNALEKACRKANVTVDVHLKLDTGMGRIGVRSADEIRQVLQEFGECPHVLLKGAFTHFASSDSDDLSYAEKQLAKFKELTSLLPSGLLLHCANSAGIHNKIFCGSQFEMARLGISLYGYPPVSTHLELKPCMSWYCQVEYVKEVSEGDKIGYGCTFTAPKPMKIATITCGYGDGYLRSASGKAKVLISGKLCPVVGRICMDQMMVDATDVPLVQAGDKVTLMGKDGDQAITAKDIAAWAGTISYEVLLSASSRVKRIYD